MLAPCKDCTDRHYLCHSTCEKYLAFREYRDKYLEHRKKEAQLLNDLYGSSRYNRKQRRRPYNDGKGGS